jgi:hypothetical protein
MSSPIHHAEDLDPALRYAPRWARDRVSPLPGRPLPPPAVRPARRARPEFSGDRAMVELQRQLMLDPDAIPEPLADDPGALRPMVLRFSAVMGLAALIAWVVVSLPGMKRAGEIVPADVTTPALAVSPVKPVDLVQAQSTDAAPAVNQGMVAMNDPAPPVASPSPSVAALAAAPAIAASQSATVPSQSVAIPSLPAAAPPAAVAPAPTGAASTLHIDDAEMTALIKRGKDSLMSGDIISARLLLRRAADAGSADAALTLGATFDPVVIRRLGAVGMTPDVAQARQWYQRAAALGSAAAMGQLAKLEPTQ